MKISPKKLNVSEGKSESVTELLKTNSEAGAKQLQACVCVCVYHYGEKRM